MINSRISFKHDIEENWLKAVNFTPLPGEIIIYDTDEINTAPRVKVGDGLTKVNHLPFLLNGVAVADILNLTDNEIPTSKAVLESIDDKVDKELGKTLSTNDFVDNDKNKLDGIRAISIEEIDLICEEVNE